MLEFVLIQKILGSSQSRALGLSLFSLMVHPRLALLSLLIHKHGQKKGDRPLYKCRAFPSGCKRH